MNIRLQWDQSQLDAFAGQLPKRFAYASVNALRATAEHVRDAEFAHARQAFTIRRDAFFFGRGKSGGVAARITTWPSVKRGIAYAEIEAGSVPPSAKEFAARRRLLYAGFETGAPRTPFTPGAKNVAQPRTGGPARPTPQSPITPELTFAKMAMRAYYRGRKLTKTNHHRRNGGVGLFGEYGIIAAPQPGGGVQWKGRSRTFIVFTPRHPGGEILQRTGPHALRFVWGFARPKNLDARLRFVATAEAAARGYFPAAVEREVQAALEHDALRALREIA